MKPNQHPRVLFFGCMERAGHYLWSSETWKASKDEERDCPWKLYSRPRLDPPTRKSHEYDGESPWEASMAQVQGEAVLSYVGGWTRLGWADRSVDSRSGSHANIIAEGTHSFDEMMALARARFPNRMKQIEAKYPVNLCLTHRASS